MNLLNVQESLDRSFTSRSQHTHTYGMHPNKLTIQRDKNGEAINCQSHLEVLSFFYLFITVDKEIQKLNKRNA